MIATPDSATAYQVKLEVFSGPLDLLLYLVRKDEVEIFDLSLERLTRQYLDFLAAEDVPDLDLAGDFIAMAAHLIYIKSRRLLPPEVRAGTGEEAEENEDPRWELIRQLLEYKKFKDAAAHLQQREIDRLDLFTRPPDAARAEQAAASEGGRTLAEVSVLDLIGAFHRVLQRVEQRPGTREIFEERFTVAEKIDHLLRLTEGADAAHPLAFSQLFAPEASRAELVVTFLALLELVRLKRLRVRQGEAFEEIEIYKREEMGLIRQ